MLSVTNLTPRIEKLANQDNLKSLIKVRNVDQLHQVSFFIFL